MGFFRANFENLQRMEPCQKRKEASRLGEQVGRAGWASSLSQPVEHFYGPFSVVLERSWRGFGEDLGRFGEVLERFSRKGLEEAPSPGKGPEG